MADLLTRSAPGQLDKAELRALLERAGAPVVTLAHPTERANVEPEENAVRLKRHRQVVHDKLSRLGRDPRDIDAWLRPVDDLLRDDEFWTHQLDGLVVYLWPDGQAIYRVPFAIDDHAEIDERPHLQPLLPALATEGHFYVLALSQQHVRLLRCTRTEVERIDLEPYDVPPDVDSAMTHEDPEATMWDHHVGPRGMRGKISHGHGGAEFDERQVEKFLRGVRNGVDQALENTRAPVVLAGVEQLLASFRSMTRITTLVEGEVRGNPEEARDDQLRADAWAHVEPVLRAPVDQAVERVRAQLGSGLALSNLPEVLQAGTMARIHTLLVRRGARRWGTFDLGKGTVDERDEPGEGDTDLVERAISLALEHDGDVFRLDNTDMPVDADVAALCRW